MFLSKIWGISRYSYTYRSLHYSSQIFKQSKHLAGANQEYGSRKIRPVFNILTVKYSESGNDFNYEHISSETLESLTDYFEDIVERDSNLASADVTYGDGVLTVALGKDFGTYVINKQSPNLQIWLSSPVSGPKRYDFINNTWIYKHDDSTLHSLLDREISKITKMEVNFSKNCLFGGEN